MTSALPVPPVPPVPPGPVAVTGPGPGRLLTRPFVSLLSVVCGSLLGFTLLLPVVPLYVAGAGDWAAGLATGALMLGTVLVELAVPRLVVTFGHRAVMTLGVVLVGIPAAVLPVSRSVPLILAVSLARGAGLGVVVVIGTALAAELVPAERRNEGLGTYGLAVGLPWIVGLPLGVWLARAVGFGPVFLVAAVLSVTGLFAVPGVRAPGAVRAGGAERSRGPLAVLRVGGVRRPVLVFTAITVAAGVFMTFLPLAMASSAPRLAAGALLAQACTAPVARWAAGRAGDRGSPQRLLVPAVLAAAAGAAVASRVGHPLAVIAGMGLFGIGFGMAQNVTLALMLRQVPTAEFGPVSAVWNVAYDAGMGAGAAGFGLLAGPVGYPTAFALTAAVIVVALGVAWRDGRLDGPGRTSLDR